MKIGSKLLKLTVKAMFWCKGGAGMTIQLNGRTVELPEDVKNVDTLLKHYNLENRIVIVELNNEIADKSKYTELPIADGDKVEMIHFVGGG